MKAHGRHRRACSSLHVLLAVLVALLAAKYLWSLTVSAVPFGYDAGIYRFLFIRHADGWPPFHTAPLPDWARSHPLGLFFFTAPLVNMGVSPDWLIGWMWNVFAMVPSLALTYVTYRRAGGRAAAALLAVAVLSVAQHEGFIAMYWKVFAALAWTVFAFRLLELRDRRWIVCGMFAIATHLQVGLVLGLSVASMFVFEVLSGYRRESLFLLWTGVLTAVLGLAWYLPNYGQAVAPVWATVVSSVNPAMAGIVAVGLLAAAGAAVVAGRSIRRPLLPPRALFCTALAGIGLAVFGGGALSQAFMSGHADTASGSFLSLPLYAQISFPLLFLGAMGFAHSVREGHQLGSPWQWALVWCAALVCSKFFFYLRFLLLFDFFLLPFAAHMLVRLWFMREHAFRWLAVALVCFQAIFAVQRMQSLKPEFTPADLQPIYQIAETLPHGVSLVSLDNYVAPWLLGLNPRVQVAGPGVFASPPYGAWEKFIYGTTADRRAFYGMFPHPLYLYAGAVFLRYYPPAVVQAVLSDPCLEPAGPEGLFKVTCPATP